MTTKKFKVLGTVNVCLFVATGCVAGESSNNNNGTATRTIKAEVWADNWFALYSGDTLIKEDSVSYNTERSFNSEIFSFTVTLPAQLSIVIKDYKENDTGLEYIGTGRQQIGDGGLIAQFVDSDSKQLLAVSNDTWRCKVVHQAPTNKSCERDADPQKTCKSVIESEPDNWKAATFDSSRWPKAVIHSAQDVRPHGGYGQVSWQPTAKFIWTEDLQIDNTLLCRFTISAPK
jgi:hypothetical protein